MTYIDCNISSENKRLTVLLNRLVDFKYKGLSAFYFF